MKIETTDIEVKDYVKKLVNVVAKTIVDSFENMTIEDVNMLSWVTTRLLMIALKNLKSEEIHDI